MQVNTKVGDPLMFLCTKVGEPPHQSRSKSALGWCLFLISLDTFPFYKLKQ